MKDAGFGKTQECAGSLEDEVRADGSEDRWASIAGIIHARELFSNGREVSLTIIEFLEETEQDYFSQRFWSLVRTQPLNNSLYYCVYRSRAKPGDVGSNKR